MGSRAVGKLSCFQLEMMVEDPIDLEQKKEIAKEAYQAKTVWQSTSYRPRIVGDITQ